MRRVAFLLGLGCVGGCLGSAGGSGFDDTADGDADTDADSDSDADVLRATEIGSGDHSPASVELVVIVDESDAFYPTGIGFPSDNPDDLWVLDRDIDSWTIANRVSSTITIDRYQSDAVEMAHFLNAPAAIAFSADEPIVGTCNENYNDYNGGTDPYGGSNDGFMGPVAWTTDRAIFDGTGTSHYDMLHESPYCMGIAWERDHVFWVFNGDDSRIDRYDFHGWHPDAYGGLGGMDHSDGEIFFYPGAQVRRVENVPSHMVHDPAGNFVYIADTGNARIARIDATLPDCSTTFGDINEPGVELFECDGTLEDVVPAGEMTQPSGLTLHTGETGTFLYATDFATGEIKAFTTDGELVNWLDTGLGEGLTGIAISGSGTVYVAQALEDRVYRIDPIVPST